MSLQWQKEYWEGCSNLGCYRPVIDPNDETGLKNQRLHDVHLKVLGRVFKGAGLTNIGTLLDYGCGIGRLRSFLSSRCGNYIGVDVSKGMASRAGGPVSVVDGQRLPFCDGAFDVIFSFWVLQHITDDAVLQQVAGEFDRILKNSGFVVICERSSRESSFERGKDKEYIRLRPTAFYRHWLSEMGFDLVKVEAVIYPRQVRVKRAVKGAFSRLSGKCKTIEDQEDGESVYVFKKI